MDYNRFVTSCTTTSLFLFLNSTDCPEKVVALFAPSHRRQHGLHNTSTKNRQTEGAIVPTSNPINPLLRSHGLHSPPQEESQHNLPTKLFFPLCWWHAITSTSIHRVPAPERRHTRLRTWACYTRRNVKWNSCGWGGDKNVVLPQRWDIYTTSTRVSGVPGHVFYTTLYTHRTCPGCYCVTSSACVLILSVLADSAADGIVLPACADKAQSGQLPLLVFWQEERGGGEGGGGGGGGCLCCNSEISRFPASTQHALVDQTKPRFSSTYKMRSLIQRCPPAALSAVGVERHPGCVAALLEHLPLCSAKLFSFTAHELQLFYLTPSGVQSRFDLWLRITDSSLWSCSIFNRNNERDFSSTWQKKENTMTRRTISPSWRGFDPCFLFT